MTHPGITPSGPEGPPPVDRITLALGRAKAPWTAGRRQTLWFRRLLEAAVIEAHGGIGLRRAKLVRTCCSAFESAQRIRKLLAEAGDPGAADSKLTHQEWLAYDTALQAREAACDKALDALGIDRPAKMTIQQSVAAEISRLAAERRKALDAAPAAAAGRELPTAADTG